MQTPEQLTLHYTWCPWYAINLIAIIHSQCDIWFHLPGHCVRIVHHYQLHTPCHSSRYLLHRFSNYKLFFLKLTFLWFSLCASPSKPAWNLYLQFHGQWKIMTKYLVNKMCKESSVPADQVDKEVISTKNFSHARLGNQFSSHRWFSAEIICSSVTELQCKNEVKILSGGVPNKKLICVLNFWMASILSDWQPVENFFGADTKNGQKRHFFVVAKFPSSPHFCEGIFFRDRTMWKLTSWGFRKSVSKI